MVQPPLHLPVCQFTLPSSHMGSDPMSATITIRDETLSGEPLHEWVLELLSERLIVRELIRSRVYQEVQDHNVSKAQTFRGLVKPEGAEAALNDPRARRP